MATFRDEDVHAHGQRLSRFDRGDWRRSLGWLDASGLALYFLDRLKSLRLTTAVPFDLVTKLESRLADNQRRTADLFDEFLRINHAFQDASLRYLNLKGFTLTPEYCPDPALRCQFDLDFLVASADAARCRDILSTFGYAATGHNENVVEFKRGPARVPSIQELYKPRLQRSVEVHLVSGPDHAAEQESSVLARSNSRAWKGAAFPALCDVDQFMAQACHLFRHVKSEWTRISWLLEFKTFVAARRNDTRFWDKTQAHATTVDDGGLAVGIATWLATEAFGEFAPRALTEWSVDAIPPAVRLWLEQYDSRIMLSDFPGSKLYLLLNGELDRCAGQQGQATLRKLLPLHCPPRVTGPSPRGIGHKIRAAVAQAKYVLFRLRFHMVEGSRYVIEARRWKRIVRASVRDAKPVGTVRVGAVSVARVGEK